MLLLSEHAQTTQHHLPAPKCVFLTSQLLKLCVLLKYVEVITFLSLTCEVDFGLAADEQAVTVLCSAVVLAHVCIAALSAFLEALY